MGSFVASPGEEEIDDGDAAGVECEAGGVASGEVTEVDIVAAEARFGGIDGEEQAEWELAQGLLEGAAHEEQVGRSEAIVGIAWEHGLIVEVGAADGGIKVKGDSASGFGLGFYEEEPEGD